MTALALRDDQTAWDDKQLAVLRAIGIEEDVSQAELDVFLHESQRRKLDPFTRQIYLIGRYDSRKRRKVYRSQTSIDGFRLIARRAADRSGIDYSYEDTIWFDANGKRHEIWLSDQPPAGAKVVVVRNGNRFDAVARYGAYVQTDRDGAPSGQWRSMGDVMVAKCAEALALRKAFPEDLGGLYTEEEMAQADNPQRVQATAEVVRDEPAIPDDEHWQVHPPAAADQAWIDEALTRAATFTTPAEMRALITEGREKLAKGEITGDDAARIAELTKAHAEELKAAKAAPATAQTVELDPDDPWAPKVEEISSADEAEAATAELFEQFKSGKVDETRANRIKAAIAARAAQVAGKVIEGQVAA